MSVPDTTQEQAGVDAYTQWKANVSNERSSAYGGNLHDLARRIYIAMTNAAPQEISAEASRQADVESSKAKKPGAPASTPCRTGEAETPCEAAPNAIVTEELRTTDRREVFQRFQKWTILLDAKGAQEFWDDVEWLRSPQRLSEKS